jgi:hypothetical protein
MAHSSLRSSPETIRPLENEGSGNGVVRGS